MTVLQLVLGALSGGLVGFVLGLFGGGGSILATPLMVYLVGAAPHVALGTSALAVAANAASGLIQHARKGTVRWRCGAMFAAAGMLGAFGGSTLGKSIDGQKLLFLFAIVMIVVGALMLRGRKGEGVDTTDCDASNAPKVLGAGMVTGAFSGFFGIGGGFLIVPGLTMSARMPMINAVGTSLVAVTAFGLTTAANYAVSGLVDWALAGIFVVGGVLGGVFGTQLASKLSGGGKLKPAFAGLIFVVAAYMLYESGTSL